MGAAACKLKIILDSDSAAGYSAALANTARAMSGAEEARLTDDVAYPIIRQIIKAEQALEAAHNLLLDAVGYSGPRPGKEGGYGPTT